MSPALVWLRWGQFVDLALVYGVPLTAWLLGDRRPGGLWRGALAVACPLGMVLSGLGFAVTVAAMAGDGIAGLDHTMLVTMLGQSALGWSVLLRLAALAAELGLVLLCRNVRAGWLAWPGGLAVASLAWGGHAAASQGSIGMIRLAGDVAHLWCGLAWLGALLLFTTRLWRMRDEDSPAMVGGLGAFALIGSVLVGVLTISGFANLLFLAPPAQWAVVAATPYGTLIIAKLAMFGMMLLLAGHNRFSLVPALERASTREARRAALSTLRRSVSLETCLALAVVWCVAFAGTLDPLGTAP